MKNLYFILLFWTMFSCGNVDKTSVTTPPNIVIIFTDDQGYEDLGCYGSPDILTKNIDLLARQGARLTNFHVAQPVCSASRAALLTGCYPNRLGIHGAFMPNLEGGLHHDEMTMAESLKQIGYSTGIFGKWHLGDRKDYLPLAHGFDEYFGIPYSNDMWPLHPQQGPVFDFGPLPLIEGSETIDTLTDQSNLTVQITERSVDFIHRNADNPFFLYVPHPQPHVPLYVSDKFRGKSERGLYGDVIMEIDWSVGQIMEALDEEGLSDNTIVIYASDNGPWLNYGTHSGSAGQLREGKGTTWGGGVKVPFIVKYPEHIAAGTTIRTPIMAIDIFPSIANLCGAPLPDQAIDGKNVWPILEGTSTTNPHEAYFFYYKRNELHGVLSDNWKMYFPHQYRSLNGRTGRDDGLPIDYDQNFVEQIELYDLSKDASEIKNVAAEHKEVVDRLSGMANNMRSKLGDQLTDIDGREQRPLGK